MILKVKVHILRPERGRGGGTKGFGVKCGNLSELLWKFLTKGNLNPKIKKGSAILCLDICKKKNCKFYSD